MNTTAGSAVPVTAPVTMLTLFTFPQNRRAWAFAQMAFARPLLRRVPGLRFRKLMGTGQGIGFTRQPDWNRYALLTVWEDEGTARNFLATSRFMDRYRRNACRASTLLLRTLQAHGSWNGQNPFLPALPAEHRIAQQEPLCVLTRATIRPQRLNAFWQMVEPVGSRLAEADGLRGSVGIGELPFIRQATLSIWESEEQMKAFAYRSGPHKTVVSRTHREQWYSEDLFARFRIIEQIGAFP